MEQTSKHEAGLPKVRSNRRRSLKDALASQLLTTDRTSSSSWHFCCWAARLWIYPDPVHSRRPTDEPLHLKLVGFGAALIEHVRRGYPKSKEPAYV